LANDTPAPDYLAWAKKDVWTLTEFSRLWVGMRPGRRSSDPALLEYDFARIRTEFRMHRQADKKIFIAAFEAALAGKLETQGNQGTRFVQPSVAMAWGKVALDTAPPEALERMFNREPEHALQPEKLNLQQLRETVLEKWLTDNNVNRDAVKSSKEEVWNFLGEISPNLFPLRSANTRKSFFRLQQLCVFSGSGNGSDDRG